MSVPKSMKHTILNFTATAVLAFASIGGQTILGQDAVQSTTTTSAGTISDFSPQTIVVKTEDAAAPVSYTYTKSTTYVDENGNPVSMETVKSGLPVTVYYVRDGDNLVASRVIVKKIVTQDAAPVIQTAPVTNVEESKTTTTTTTTK
jgi:hypothetical protein